MVPSDDLAELIQEMIQTDVSAIQGRPLTKKALALEILKRIPFLTGFLGSVDATGTAFSKLAAVKGALPASSVAQGFQIGGVVLSALNFIRIPLIYAASWVLGVESPVTLSKNARWLYSTVTLALGITALAVPVAAPIIGLTLAVLGVTVAVFTLGKHFYDQRKKKESLALVQSQIEGELKALESIKLEAANLIKNLDSLTAEQIENSKARLNVLNDEFSQKKEKLQKLRDSELHLQQKLEKFGRGSLLNKGLGLGLASLALAGGVVSIFFPPIGLAIIGATAAIGVLYILGALAVGIYTKMFKADNKPKEAESPDTPQEGETLAPSIENTSKLEHSSVYHISEILGGKKQAAFLQKEIEQAVFMESVTKNLDAIVRARDPDKVIEFYKKMALYTKEHDVPFVDMRLFAENDLTMKKGLAFLKQTLKEHALTKEDYDILQCYQPFTRLLETKEVVLPSPKPSASEQEQPLLNDSALEMDIDKPQLPRE